MDDEDTLKDAIRSLRAALQDIRDRADMGWTDVVTGAFDAASPEAEAFDYIRTAATDALEGRYQGG